MKFNLRDLLRRRKVPTVPTWAAHIAVTTPARPHRATKPLSDVAHTYTLEQDADPTVRRFDDQREFLSSPKLRSDDGDKLKGLTLARFRDVLHRMGFDTEDVKEEEGFATFWCGREGAKLFLIYLDQLQRDRTYLFAHFEMLWPKSETSFSLSEIDRLNRLYDFIKFNSQDSSIDAINGSLRISAHHSLIDLPEKAVQHLVEIWMGSVATFLQEEI